MKISIVIFALILLLTGYRLFLYKPVKQSYVYTPAYIRLNRPTNIIDRTLKRLYPEPQASLLSGILVGTKAQMPKDFFNNLQKTGTLHIIALSGTNISVLISFLFLVFGRFGKKISAILAIAGIILFILFVGPSASVVRAGIMGSMQMLSVLSSRLYLALCGLILSGLIIIVISPQTLFDIGFQLSFMATLGLILLGSNNRRIDGKNFISRLITDLLINLKITLSAQIFTMPIVVYNFHQMSFIAPVSNILIGWTVNYLMFGGFIVSIGGILLYDLAFSLSILLLPLLNWFVGVVNITSDLPFAATKLNSFPLWAAYLYYAFLAIVSIWPRRKSKEQ